MRTVGIREVERISDCVKEKYHFPRTPRTHRLSDIVNHNGTICIPVVHRSQRFIPLLTSSVPDLKFYCGLFIKADCLSKESRSNCTFSIIIKLIFDKTKDETVTKKKKERSNDVQYMTYPAYFFNDIF